MTKISKYYQRKYGLQEEIPAADLASSGNGEVKLSKYYQRKYGMLGNSEQVENRDWAEGKPEQPKVTQPRFTWDVPADAATIDKRFQAVSPTQFQQNQQLLRKYGGNYENYLNDNRRNFSSAAEYEQTVARARQYNSSVQLQSAQTRVDNAEKAAQDVAVEAERIQRSAENLQGLYDRYQQTGDVADGQTYLLAAQAHKQALEAYQEKYKAYEKEWDDAYKAYDTARSRAEKDQAAYLKASERYQQEIAEIQSRASDRGTFSQGAAGGFGSNKPGNLPEGRSTGAWSSGPVEFLDKTFTATRAGQMDWISGMAALDRKAGNAMLRLGASILVDISKLTGNQKLRETADAWWEKSYNTVSKDAMDAKAESQALMKQALSGTGVVDGWIVQQMESVGSMMMDIFAAGTTGAMSLPEGASTLQIMGTRAAGSAMLEAQQKGYSELEQVLVGVAVGSLEMLSEKLFGGNPLYDTDKGLVNRMVEAVTDNPVVLRLLYSKGFDILGEGLEEVFTEVLDPIAEGLIANHGDIDWASEDEIIQAFLGGVFLSLLGKGTEVVVRNVSGEASAQRKTERELGKWAGSVDAAEALVAEGLEADRRSDAYWNAVRLQEKMDAGKTLSMREIGRQLLLNQEAIDAGKLVNQEVETPADAPDGALHDPETGFYAIRTEKAGDGSTNYQVVEVSEDGTIMEKTEKTPSLFAAKLAAETEGWNIRNIGTSEALLASLKKGSQEADTAGPDRNDAGNLQTVGDLEEQKAQATTNPENARPIEGIQWAGNTKEIETEVMNDERAEPRTVDQSGSRGQDTGDPAGNGEKNPRREAARALGRRAEEARRVQANVQAVGGKLTSLRELGMKDGSEEKNIRLVSREAWTPDVEEAWEIADSEGLEFIPISGQLRATAQNGNEIKFVAALQNGTLYVQADSMKQSIREAILHEVFHEKVRKNPGLRDRLIEQIKKKYSMEETQAMFERYYQAYQKAYGGTMTDEELELAVWEEMLADAYAELQRYSDTFGPAAWAEDVQETVWGSGERMDGSRTDAEMEGSRYSMNGITDGEQYSYEALIAKPPVKIVEVQERDIPTQGKKVKMLEIAEEGRNKASVLYNDMRGKQRYVYIKDLGANVLVPVKGFTHGLTGNKTSGSTMRTAEITYDLVDILRNSVAVNERDQRSEKDGDFSYILFGYARKADGQEYIVKSTVNHFGINKSVVDSVEIYDVLKGSKAKKVETEVIGSHTGTSPAARVLNASVSTEISVADLLEAVKENYPELLPDNVREYFGIQNTKKEPGLRFSLDNREEAASESKEGAAPFKTGTIQDGTPGGDTPSGLSLLQSAQDVKEKGDEIRFSIDREINAKDRAERELSRGLAWIMHVPKKGVKQLREGPVRSIMVEYQRTGEISQELVDEAVNNAFEMGLMIDSEYYEQYKPIEDYLRSTAVTLDKTDQKDISNYIQFKKKAYGTIRIVERDGVSVNVVYEKLQGIAPELFPDDISNPAEQLMHMYDIGKQIKKAKIPLERALGKDRERFISKAKERMNSIIYDTLEKYARSVEWKKSNKKDKQMTKEEKALSGNMRDWIQYVMEGGMTPKEFSEQMKEANAGILDGRAAEIAKRLENSGKNEHLFRPADMTDEEYATLDAQWNNRKKRTEEQHESAQDWIVPKTNFRSTPAMEKLEIRVDGSVTRYRETAQLRAYERAAVEAKRILQKRVKALKATDQEQTLARGIADGLLTPDALNADKIDIDTVTELADYVMAARAFNEDMIARRRSEINGMNYQIADELFQDSEAYHPKLAFIPNLTKIVMNERTPERVAKQIFGEEQGGKIYETYFRPVWVNGAEMYRFENRMLQRVEQFEDQNGVKRKLTAQEREFAQRLMEGEAVQENLRRLDADTRERVVAVAQNVNNGMEFVDAVREHGLTDEYHMGLAQAYADYLVTETLSKDMDRTILANAIREYQAIYNELYEAINDFLVSHGYHEIGFIKGYAPHFQKRAVQQGLFGALKSLGVEKESVSELPASIAGRTADFKPNMKWNPHMQTRKGTKTDYDIQEGFEQYLHYVAEMFYHTDDVMRVRQAVNWFRGQYSGDEIRMEIEDAEVDRYKSTEWKKEFLKEKGELKTGDNLDARTVETMYDDYVSKLFDRAKPENLQKYSEFVTWMDNYANIVAGKQSMADRALEDNAGRIFLNVGNKLMQIFTKANVAGNLSSVLNQSAQLPLIQQQLGTYMERAIFDMARGGLKKDSFAERSDFLTDKRGVEKLTMDNYEKVISAMFKPAEMMDRLVSTIAVRGRYLQALNEGMDIDQAMKEADDFGRRVMGSRMKGAKPLAFERKGPINQMLHVFQVEASNTFDYMFLSDMPQAVKQVAKTKGKAAAGRYTAAAVVGYLLNAFLLNRLTDFIYGGTPAPFDLMGWFLEFVAGGWGRSDEEYLKTLIDNGWEAMFQERPFETERIDTSSGLDWAGSMKNLGYNILNDIPYVRNAAGVMGLGDQSLPTVGINEFFKNLGSAGATLWNQAVKGEEETGLDWAGAAMSAGEDVGNAAVMLLPGGRQMKKTAQGIAAMIRGGAYTGYGDNQRLKYPVEQNILNAIRAGLYGLSALEETDAYYAGGSSLTAEQTKRVKELEDLGVDRFTSYGLYQDFREINQKMTGAEAKTAKREAIDGLPLEDAQKLELYMKTMVGDKGNPEKTRQKYQELLDEGVSWHQLTQLDNAITQINLDEDDDGEPDLSALERGIAKRNEIAAMDLSSWKKLEVFDQYVLDRTAKNYEKIRQEYEAMLDAGLSWEDVTRAHNTYAELEADEELNATQKATEYAKWADEQSWNAGQKKAIKERYKFWQMIPAEATTYEKFTDAGLSSDSSDVVTKLLASLEPEAGKDAVSIKQKVLAIDGSSLSKAEKTTAIAAMKPEQMDKLSEVGVSNSTAEQITAELALEEAKNGDDNLSTIRRARISVDAAKDNDEAMAALSVIVSKDTYPKIQLAAEFDVKAENWVEFKELWADWYGEDSVSQEKVENVLDDMYLTKEQKAALWQISNKSWKPKNNPYSVRVGEDIFEMLNQ